MKLKQKEYIKKECYFRWGRGRERGKKCKIKNTVISILRGG